MDFMVPAGICLDLADGTICLPDEVRLQMAGRRPLYGDKIEHEGDRWVPTITVGPGKTRYLQVTNVSDHALTLHEGSRVAMWLSGDRIPGLGGRNPLGPRVERPEYMTPISILRRSEEASKGAKIAIVTGSNSPQKWESVCARVPEKEDRPGYPDASTAADIISVDLKMDDEDCIKEGEHLSDGNTALCNSNYEVKIEDLHVGDAKINTSSEIKRLLDIIWRSKHLLIGKVTPYHQRRKV
ncbi:Hypothetical protein PHPALM_13104 [Phytophthora palmivora]|uniref:Uncharacterized protein n=1 Tax=Phytophthora palmivora TaxID=4796 RepID=A0A2P4XY25_9STRA|nr:Hypothetical protein PHPALM_13104 [Phytophthora palmivora]